MKKILLASLCALSALSVSAEQPMQVDDAGTLTPGDFKLESVLARDHKVRSGEWAFGFAPVTSLEVGLSATRAFDREPQPNTKLQGAGVNVKWVPVQSATGWSLGASLAYGHLRIHERATPAKYNAKAYALTGLATYRLESDQVVHLNLGAQHTRAQGSSENAATWGAGYEQPLTRKLRMTAEVFGQEHAGPDKALGLRYEVAPGLKLSAAMGRGNDRNFGRLGMAWEF